VKSFNMIFLALFLMSMTAQAGWESSGGESFKLEKNPWFLKNVDTVKYCVLVDESSITAPVDGIKSAIKFAFSFWKEELKLKEYPRGFTPVGDQDFVFQEKCVDGETDIEFKFGYGKLTTDEINHLKDPTTYVGVAIRKEYNEETMRGSGAVYISSDKGPYVYKNKGQLVPEAWSKPKLLTYALIHEIGHIMGIAHLGSGVMSETFLTSLLNNSTWTFYASRPYISLTRPLEVAEVCTLDLSDIVDPIFFGLDETQKCVRFERKSGSSSEWSVYSRASKESSQREAGSLKITNAVAQGLSQKPIIFVYLTETQKVFKTEELSFAEFLVGGIANGGIHQGIFTVKGSHKPNHVQINADPESIVVSGVVTNQIKPVFSHRLPSLKGIVLP
jgi:hypothetical protein